MKEKQKLQEKLNDIVIRLYHSPPVARSNNIGYLASIFPKLDVNQKLVVKMHLEDKLTNDEDLDVREAAKAALEMLGGVSVLEKQSISKNNCTNCFEGVKVNNLKIVDCFDLPKQRVERFMSYYEISKGTCEVSVCKTCGRYTIKIEYTIVSPESEDSYIDFLVLKKNSEVEEFVKTKEYLELIKTSKYWLFVHRERVKIMDQYVERRYYEHYHIWCVSEC